MLAGTTRPMTGRQIARLVGASHEGVRKVLRRAADQGLVHREPAGRATMYALNRDHVAAAAVELLAGLRNEFVQRARGALADWYIQPVHASVFGSSARGDGDVDSDIDLLVVRPRGVQEENEAWRSQLDLLTSAVRAWTGNHASIVELPEEGLRGPGHPPPPVVAEVRRDAIDLAGKPVRELLGKR